jgi:arginine-tRNA-protein transferase
LDDLLIAVGVVDVLPTGLSSVYLFYHPSFSHDLVALGKYAILQEVQYTLQQRLPYYYLGYYIESCPKMRYKGDYHPSQLLCPTTYQWVDAEIAIPKLQQTPQQVCTLVEEEDTPTTTNNDSNNDLLLNQLYMDIGAGMNVTFSMLQPSGQRVVQPILEEFLQEAGPEISKECLVKLT